MNLAQKDDSLDSRKYLFDCSMVANLGVGQLFAGEQLIDTRHGVNRHLVAEPIGYFSLPYCFRVDKQRAI